MPSNQKKIRDLNRILKRLRSSLENGEQAEKTTEEREKSEVEINQIIQRIAELENAKENNKLKDLKKKHESRYHMVKFFERKKVTRLIHKIIKQLNNLKEHDFEARKKLESQRQALEDDLTYIMYYPINMKYVALYAESETMSQNDEEDDREPNEQIGDRKNSILISKAREIARESRKEDIVKNGADRVEHAIQVELNPKAARNNAKKFKQRDPELEKTPEPSSQRDKKRKSEEIAEKSESKKSRTQEKQRQIAEAPRKLEEPTTNNNAELEDDFFVEGGQDEGENHGESSKPKTPRLNYQQIKQTVNHRKFTHHKRFSSKPNNMKKF